MGEKVTDRELERAIDSVLDTVAANLRELMRTHIAADNKPLELAKRTGLGKGTIQRVLGGSAGYGGQEKSAASVDTLMRLAWCFKVPVVSLFVRHDTTSVVLDTTGVSDEAQSPRALKSPGD